ncbi:Tetratricopeptide repeat (TPR)-like superfamily protein [Euphorbia peplus]|nr:Tetratricopeptide repeat (TPR)-like superfamily protein [Euphorbia peplus]
MRARNFFHRTFISGNATRFSKPPPLPPHHIRVLATCGRIDEALTLFYNLSPPYSDQTYAALFHACSRHGYLKEGTFLHHHMISHNPRSQLGLFVTNHLINMYAKLGHFEVARKLFDEMPDRNVVSWTALISGYSRHGKVYECLDLFSEMLISCRPNEFAFSSVLCCCGYEYGVQVHGVALKMGLGDSVYVGNVLICMYSKYGCCEEAWNVFEGLESRNLATWNSMIGGFQVQKFGGKAVGLFRKMYSDGIGFDRVTMLSVLSSLSEMCIDNVDLGVKFCSQLHCLSAKSALLLQIQVATALVKTYSDFGEVNDCYKLFSETGCSRDIVSWTGMITAFAERQPEEALFLFRLLNREEDLAPDFYTFSIIVKACAGLGTERHTSAVHSQAIKSGFDNDGVLANALIHAYARCGSVSYSKQVFDEMRFRNVVSWNSMLKAYSVHGQAKEALDLFSEMNVDPDSATMVSVLSACSHGGMVEEGIKIFDSMLDRYGISPKLDHYACVVDMLGRAGRVIEAKELISGMPMEPDSVIWSALLSSCRKHGVIHLAKFASDKLKELEPGNSLGYVQMSNIYCSGGSYKEAGTIRNEMKGSKVSKEPGLSWIEIGNRVHEFASGGKRHPQRTAICVRLDALVRELREIGYVPETSLALHDIEEEHKEEQLYHHSEKLALAFAIMNETSGNSGRSVIKIMKNIRICVDCHNFMKLASDFLHKEVVVRDSNRFHHFKNGICSCGDYW